MPQGKKVAIGFQSYDLTRIANVRVADMVLAEAAFPGIEKGGINYPAEMASISLLSALTLAPHPEAG